MKLNCTWFINSGITSTAFKLGEIENTTPVNSSNLLHSVVVKMKRSVQIHILILPEENASCVDPVCPQKSMQSPKKQQKFTMTVCNNFVYI